MHQSGTHYLKHIVACALAHRYGISDPEFNHANDIFGGPRDSVVYPDLPRLISSHSWPNPAVMLGGVRRFFELPPYVLLVRDIRFSLISNYAKWSHSYNVPFTTYLRGSTKSVKFNSDIWWAIRFLNGWGMIRKHAPLEIKIVKYEDLIDDPKKQINRLSEYWNLSLSSSDIEYGISQSSKSKMLLKDDPARPKGAVRKSNGHGLAIFTLDDRAYFEKTCCNYLRFPLGYDYSTW